MNHPRPEHPNPQWQRANWQNLNGQWEFGFNKNFGREITVPFCAESQLSGIGHTGFLFELWYRRKIKITQEQLRNRVMLHFGAVDYLATVWINGGEAGRHEGGYTSFAFDITKLLRPGENEITLRCEDNNRDPLILAGKQSWKRESFGCNYTRTTGVWQTVWLEFLPAEHIISAQYQPDPENGCLHIQAKTDGQGSLTARALWEGREVGCAAAKNSGNAVRLTLPLNETHLWEIGKGDLYDLELTFNEDKIKSYFGLRSIRLEGRKFLINEKSVFQRLVLDQGFYPDGIYTAPTAEALENDIKLSMAAGFNGARLHEKVFEPLFLYYCDKHGYLAWGEYPNWAAPRRKGKHNDSMPELLHKFLPQWCEAVERDRNHPSIVGWCPFNETHGNQFDGTLRAIYEATKSLDPDRPCIDTSGYVHVVTDIFDLHDYEQVPSRFAAHYENAGNGEFYDSNRGCGYIPGQPMFVSEYGGIGWDTGNGWGYGKGPKTEEEFKARYEGLTTTLLQNPNMFAFCYTQLTDVEQERNGVYTYERKPKIDPAFFHKVNTQKAAIEE